MVPERYQVEECTKILFQNDPYFLSQYSSHAHHMQLDLSNYNDCKLFKRFIMETLYLVVALDCSYLDEFQSRHPEMQLCELFRYACSKYREICLPTVANYTDFASSLCQHEQAFDLLAGKRHGYQARQIMQTIIHQIAADLHQLPFFMASAGQDFYSTTMED